jgi:hypothetical protein
MDACIAEKGESMHELPPRSSFPIWNCTSLPMSREQYLGTQEGMARIGDSEVKPPDLKKLRKLP